jgi:hypothetical protein
MRPLVTLIVLASMMACSTPQKPQPAPVVAAPVVAAQFTAGRSAHTPLPGSGGALGSGCTPGAGALPDGAWYGYARDWDADGIDFDLACFYTGAAADAQAAARADEEPPNDFYLVNDDITTRRLAVDGTVAAYRLAMPDDVVGLEQATYAELIGGPGVPNIVICPGEWCSIWVFINDGRVTEMMEQYLP